MDLANLQDDTVLHRGVQNKSLRETLENNDKNQMIAISNHWNTNGQTALHLNYDLSDENEERKNYDYLLFQIGANPNEFKLVDKTPVPFAYYFTIFVSLFGQSLTIGHLGVFLQVLILNWKAGLNFKILKKSFYHFQECIKWLGLQLVDPRYYTLHVFDPITRTYMCKLDEETYDFHRYVLLLFKRAGCFSSYTTSKGKLKMKLCRIRIPLQEFHCNRLVNECSDFHHLLSEGNSPACLQDIAGDVVRINLKPNALIGIHVLELPQRLKNLIVHQNLI